MLDFHSLRHFLTLVEAGSFSRAAKRLYVTQPAVSHQIRELERTLGLRLLVRGHGTLELTDPGKFLYEFCQDLFHRLEEAETRIQDLKRSVRGVLRLGSPMGILDGWLMDHLVAFHREYPEIEYQIVVGSDETMRELLVERKLDVAMLLEGVSRHSALLEHLPVFQEEFILLASGKEKRAPRAAQRDWASLPFIVYEENDYMLGKWLATNAPDRENPITIRHAINHIPAMIAMVKAGLGIAVLPRHAVEAELSDGSLTEVRPPIRRVTNRFHLAYRKQRFLPIKTQSLTEFLKQVARID